MLILLEPDVLALIQPHLDIMSAVRLASASATTRRHIWAIVHARPELLTKRVVVPLMEHLTAYFTVGQRFAPNSMYCNMYKKNGLTRRAGPLRRAFVFHRFEAEEFAFAGFDTQRPYFRLNIWKRRLGNKLRKTTLGFLRVTPTTELAGTIEDTYNHTTWAYADGVFNSLVFLNRL